MKIKRVDEVTQDQKRRDGIVEGVVPLEAGAQLIELGDEACGLSEFSQRVRFAVRPGGVGELECVDPWTEAMHGKGAEKAFLGARVVGHHAAAA